LLLAAGLVVARQVQAQEGYGGWADQEKSNQQPVAGADGIISGHQMQDAPAEKGAKASRRCPPAATTYRCGPSGYARHRHKRFFEARRQEGDCTETEDIP